MSNKYIFEGVTVSKKVRDGYLGDLPEDLQTKVMEIHKIIKKAIDDTLAKEGYEDLKSSRWAMSCIEDFGAMPKDKSDVGSVRVYKKGKSYKTMIQATGHFTNHEYGWIEELLHDFICDVFNTVRPTVRKKYDMTITNEGKNGSSYEGFDIFPTGKINEELWEKFSDRKTKGITAYECVIDPETGDVEFEEGHVPEISDDLMMYYECYADQMSYDQYFSEKSHGKLKFDFRVVFDLMTGNKVKIVYSLDNIKMHGAHHYGKTVSAYYNPSNKKIYKDEGLKHEIIPEEHITFITDKGEFRYVNGKYVSAETAIKRTGQTDHNSSNQKVLAIVDLKSNKNLKEIYCTGPVRPIDNMEDIIGDIDKIKELEAKGDPRVQHLEVGKIDTNPKYKSTFWPKKTNHMSDDEIDEIDHRIAQVGINNMGRTSDLNINFGKRKRVHTENAITESAETPSYNTDMSEGQAKRTLRTLSQSIINESKSNKSKKVVQYTANIYANVITKNLLPAWAGSFRKFTLTLSDTLAPNTVEFKVPKMTQDFVARFIQGRENIEGFLHRQPEVKMYVSPRLFNTMKEPDDAFNFFKSAIQYYDKKVGRAGERLMAEVMRLDHSLKHLIGTTKLSGIVTYPMSLLFVFDDVDMNSKNNFELSAEDIKVVSQFVRNISSHYAAPEKEKKTIVDDVQKMVKTLRESCTMDDNIKDLGYLSEAVSQLYSNAFKSQIEAADAAWIKEQVDLEAMKNHPDPQVHYLQEKFGVKKLKKIPADLIAYIQIETESIRDANDKMMISSYCLSKLEIVEWYIELLNVGSEKYIVPHTKPYLESVRTQLLACFKKIMATPIPKADRPIIDIQYPKGYEG